MTSEREDNDFFLSLESQRLAAARTHNVARLREFLHDDFVFIHSNARVDGKQQYLDLIGSGDLTYKEIHIRDPAVRRLGNDVATVLSRLDLTVVYMGTTLDVAALVLATWVASETGWKAWSVQSTPVPNG